MQTRDRQFFLLSSWYHKDTMIKEAHFGFYDHYFALTLIDRAAAKMKNSLSVLLILLLFNAQNEWNFFLVYLQHLIITYFFSLFFCFIHSYYTLFHIKKDFFLSKLIWYPSSFNSFFNGQDYSKLIFNTQSLFKKSVVNQNIFLLGKLFLSLCQKVEKNNLWFFLEKLSVTSEKKHSKWSL